MWVLHWRDARQAGGRWGPLSDHGPCGSVVEHDATPQLVQLRIIGHAGDLAQITLAHLVPRFGDSRLQLTVVRQQHQPFRIKVQAPCRVDAGHRYEIGQRRSTLRIRELAEDLKWLVQQNQRGQTVPSIQLVSRAQKLR